MVRNPHPILNGLFNQRRLIFDSCLRRGDTGDGHAEGGAADVVHAKLGAELNGAGLATVLATDADFEFGTG